MYVKSLNYGPMVGSDSTLPAIIGATRVDYSPLRLRLDWLTYIPGRQILNQKQSSVSFISQPHCSVLTSPFLHPLAWLLPNNLRRVCSFKSNSKVSLLSLNQVLFFGYWLVGLIWFWACFFFFFLISLDLNKKPVDGFSAGLVDDSNIFEWSVTIIGPPDTL